MHAFWRRQEQTSPELKTPGLPKEQHIKSHPLEVDSDEASFTSSLDNQTDFRDLIDVHRTPSPSPPPLTTANKINQQATRQTADVIASSTPVSHAKAEQMAGSMHSLAHEVAFAAAKRAGKFSQDIEAVASSGNAPDDHAPHQSTTSVEDGGYHDYSSMTEKPLASLADILTSAHAKSLKSIKTAIAPNDVDQPEQAAVADLQQSASQAAQTVITEAKSALADANSFPVRWLNWTLSTLYFSAGIAGGITEGLVKGLRAI